MLYFRLAILMYILVYGPCLLEAKAIEDSLTTGVVIDTVYCKLDPDQSYSLVLPTGYESGMKWPVVFIFEPGARGSMAAGIFLEASERFGIITIASNNSSNQSNAGSLHSAESMFRDARMRFNLDSLMFFVAGFSGGSRLASNLAIEHHFIKGVIGCGAGLYHNKSTHPEFRNSFYYYGIIGRRDMNLQDMIDTEERLSQSQVGYHIQYIETQHVWPPAEEITSAMAWLRYKIDSTDYDARDYFLSFQKEKVHSMEEQMLFLDAASRIQSVERIIKDSGLHDQLNLILDDKIYRKQVRQKNKAFEMELKLQKRYLDALSEYVYATKLRPDTVHTLQWWDSEIDILKNWIYSKNIEVSRLAYRLLYLLKVHFNEDIRHYQESGQLDKVRFLSDLWLMIPREEDNQWLIPQ